MTDVLATQLLGRRGDMYNQTKATERQLVMKKKIGRIIGQMMRRHPGVKNIPHRESMRIAHGIAGCLTCKSFVRKVPDEVWLGRYIKILESFVAYGEDNDYFIDQPGKVDQAVLKAMIYVHPKAEEDEEKTEMQAIRRAADVLIAGGADAVLAELCRVGLYETELTEFPELSVAAG